MNYKQIEILKCLLKSNNCLPSQYLSKVLNISTRTVKRYIDVMNEEMRLHNMEIVLIRGVGYQLTGALEAAKMLIKEGSAQEENEDRIHQMILHFLEAQLITAEELAKRMNYSVSTINNAMPELKAILKKYDLEIVSKPYYGMSIEGKEINLRSLFIDYGFFTKENRLTVEILNISIEEYDCIYRILLDYLKKHNIVIADRDIHNLLERITVSVSRTKQGYNAALFVGTQKKKDFDIVSEILNQIALALNIVFSEYEYYYVSVYSGFIAYDFVPGDTGVENTMHDFLRSSLEEISIVSGVDFLANEHILDALSTHLNILLTRADQNIKLKNPLLQQMKSEYAIEMNYAIFLAKKMQEVFQIKVSEDELAYLAMYFGAAKKQHISKKRAVIVCHYGVGTAQLIAQQIRQEVSGLEIIGVYPVHYMELAQAQDIDFIISTIKIDNYNGEKEIIYVDSLLESDSLNKLKKILSEENSNLALLLSWIHEDTWIHLEAVNAKEAVEKMANAMIEKKLIDKDIKNSIWEREQISSTDIGNLVAIPHTIFHGYHSSVVGIGILKKPVLWDKERVQLIFMICMNSIDNTSSSAFRHLYTLMKDIRTVNHLIDAVSYKEFIAWMKGEKK